MADKNTNEGSKISIIETFLRYLSRTKLVILFLHLLWIIIACSALSFTYILAFHFTSLIKVYEEAHNIKNFNNNLYISAKTDKDINDLLSSLLISTKSNRAYVFRYHNGLAAVSGVPFFFQTNTHEVIFPGTARVMQFEQHIPASISISMNNQFMNNQCIVLSDIDKDKNSQNYYLFQVRGAKAIIRCPIFMKNGDLFGFVGVDYSMSIDKKTLDDNYLSKILESAGQLAKVFSGERR